MIKVTIDLDGNKLGEFTLENDLSKHICNGGSAKIEFGGLDNVGFSKVRAVKMSPAFLITDNNEEAVAFYNSTVPPRGYGVDKLIEIKQEQLNDSLTDKR